MPKGKRGGKKGKERAPTKKKKPQEEEKEKESGSEVSESNLGSPISEEEDDVFPSSHQTSKFTEAQDELIASFFEDHLAFYDLTSPDYKNRVKKNALLKEFADEMGLAPSKIMTRFRSMRTDYFKLRGKQQKGKSGKGQTRLTPHQEFKLKRYEFLAPHYRGRTKSSVLGSVAQPESNSDESDEEVASSIGVGEDLQSSTGAKRQDSESSLPAPKKSKKKEPKRDLAEMLGELLSESRKELKQSQAAVAEASTSAGPSTSGMSEREAWAQWMSSVHQDIPPELWRAYQQETLLVAMRFARQHQANQQQQPLQQQQYSFVAPQRPLQQQQYSFVAPQRPQQQPVVYLNAPQQQQQQTFQRPTSPRVRSAPVPTSSWQDTSPGVLIQAMATLHGSTDSPGGMNFTDLLGSASQTPTPTTIGLTDSFSQVLTGLTRDSGEQAQSDTHEDED